MSGETARRTHGLLTAYYLATPLFAYVDWLGANVRAVGLADFPEWRTGYYVACTAIGAANFLKPAWAAPLGLVESSTNILLLALAVVLPYSHLIDVVAGGGPPQPLPFTPEFFINFLISSGVALSQYYRARAMM